ncbi:MAG: hypothetical protein IKD69_03960 [Solobacterium sp.]|nr:hypothetical protein [Solobacterium sp.]
MNERINRYETSENEPNKSERAERNETKEVLSEMLKSVSTVARNATEKANEGARKIRSSLEDIQGYQTNENQNSSLNQEEVAFNGMDHVGGMILAEHEIVIKRYLCAYLNAGLFGKDAKNKGYLTITNQRVIYEGSNKSSRICMETPIDSVGSIRSFYGMNYNIMLIIVFVLMIWFGFLSFPSRGVPSPFSFLLIVGGVLGVILSFRKAYMLQIFSGSVTGTAISIGEGPQGVVGNQAFYTLVAAPTYQTQQMISEIGAIIRDVQMLGDSAIEKWK